MSARAPLLLAALAALALGACRKGLECSSPELDCGGTCVDSSRDPANCGACGVSCGSGQTCCSGCVDLQTSTASCGACGNRCPIDGVCSGGVCSCPAGLPDQCDTNPGVCVNLQTAAGGYCGTCGWTCYATNVPVAKAPCVAGVCQCAGTPDAVDCGNGGYGQCVNTLVDPLNCGTCYVTGGSCASSKPGSRCDAGACTCAGTATPLECGGACVNPQTDPAHCGGCATTCSGLTPSCSNGKCCPTGQTWCGSSCVDTRTSTANCGACGNACPGDKVCNLGACACPGARPTSCGTLCCEGTACCAGGTACQAKHSNGVGGFFYDCTATYASTTRALAVTAAQSWFPGGTPVDTTCSATCIFVAKDSNTCGVWCYGTLADSRAAITPCTALCTPFNNFTASPWP